MTETLQTVDTGLSKGDTVTLGTVVESRVITQRGGIRLLAAYSGEPQEYVVVTKRFDGNGIELPDGAQILTVTTGNGMANSVAWILMPKSLYGDGGDGE